MNGEQLISEFKKIYGPEKGMQIYMNVMPGILADFNKMLGKAGEGQRVEEEYVLEDGKAVLRLSGRMNKTNGIPEIEMVLR